MKAFVSAAAISLLACTAAHAQTNPLLGNWRIVSAGVAPWIGADKILHIKEDNARRFVKQKISFAADQVKSRDPPIAEQGIGLRMSGGERAQRGDECDRNRFHAASDSTKSPASITLPSRARAGAAGPNR